MKAICSTRSGEHVITVDVPDEHQEIPHVVKVGDRLFVLDDDALVQLVADDLAFDYVEAIVVVIPHMGRT